MGHSCSLTTVSAASFCSMCATASTAASLLLLLRHPNFLFFAKLVNLARLGNENVMKQFNLRNLYSAAVEVTKVTTGKPPHPRVEVYGAQAMDIVFSDSGMGSAPADTDLCQLLDKESIRNVRVSPLADEGMMRQKLDSTFGKRDWEESILETMIITIHLDLEHGHSWNYNTKAGLLDLYVRAGGTKHTDVMSEEVLNTSEDNPLIRELKEKFLGCRGSLDDTVGSEGTPLAEWASERRKSSIATMGNETMRQIEAAVAAVFADDDAGKEWLSYDVFYRGFLAPYHVHETANSHNPLESRVVVETLKYIDCDGNGRIDWHELCLRAIWVLENTDLEHTRWWSLQE